jgi:hypothetical protein
VKSPRTFAEPTPFGQARAAAIWAGRGCQGAVDHLMTDGEDEFVHAVWNLLPGYCTWQDALLRIVRGEVGPDVGVAVSFLARKNAERRGQRP